MVDERLAVFLFASILATSCVTVSLDLPRFGGQLRAWDQGIWSDGILPSCLVSFFCSASSGAILPSRPARWCGRRAQRRSRTAPFAGGRTVVPSKIMYLIPGAGPHDRWTNCQKGEVGNRGNVPGTRRKRGLLFAALQNKRPRNAGPSYPSGAAAYWHASRLPSLGAHTPVAIVAAVSLAHHAEFGAATDIHGRNACLCRNVNSLPAAHTGPSPSHRPPVSVLSEEARTGRRHGR
jgi:hypothetical protein